MLFFLLAASTLFAGSPAAYADATIVVQDSPLAGYQYHAGREVWAQLAVGDALTLVREPDNGFDANAVRVDWRGRKLGYVPRRDNAHIARLLDRGQVLHARIVRLAESRDPWARVRFEILLPLATDTLQADPLQKASP